MTEKHQVYKCKVCGNIVEMLHEGKGTLVCCGANMDLFEEKTTDEGLEKHVPVINADATGTHVMVGSTQHPMEEKHHIEWIQIITRDGKSVRKFLQPGNTPDAHFCEDFDAAKAGIVREYCNIHGLWKG